MWTPSILTAEVNSGLTGYTHYRVVCPKVVTIARIMQLNYER